MHCTCMAIINRGTFDLLYTQLWKILSFPSIFVLNFLIGELANMISVSSPLPD